MPRPILATISAGALSHNLKVAKAYASGARLWAVIKANGYGHGVERAARALDAADGFAVLDFQEAARLRAAGVTQPILMLEGFFKPVDLPLLLEHELTPVIHNAEPVATLRLASNAPRMHAQVRSVTLMPHFAAADGASGIRGQLDWFNALAKEFAA